MTSPKTTSPPGYIADLAKNVVYNKYKEAMEFASTSIEQTQDTINRLSQAIKDLRGIDYTVNIPQEPAISIPEIPTAPSVPNISESFPMQPTEVTIPAINIDDLSLPNFEELNFPFVHIDPGNTSYQSLLLDAVRQKLYDNIIAGDIGIPEGVERDIYLKEYERNLQELNDAKDRIASDWSKRKLPLPDGALINAMTQADVAFAHKYNDVSRDIRIKRTELSVQNMQFSIQNAIQLESVLMDFTNKVSQRLYEASRAIIETKIAVINALLTKYKVMVDIYTAIVNARVEHARGIAQVYSAQVEAFRSTVSALVAKMEANIKTFLAEVEVYKTKSSVFSDITRLNIAMYETRVKEAIERANIFVKDAEIRLQNHKALEGMKLEGLKAIANTFANFVAGALSSVSAGVTLGARGDIGESFSEQRQDSYQLQEKIGEE